jgi:hypothetical protein
VTIKTSRRETTGKRDIAESSRSGESVVSIASYPRDIAPIVNPRRPLHEIISVIRKASGIRLPDQLDQSATHLQPDVEALSSDLTDDPADLAGPLGVRLARASSSRSGNATQRSLPTQTRASALAIAAVIMASVSSASGGRPVSGLGGDLVDRGLRWLGGATLPQGALELA